MVGLAAYYTYYNGERPHQALDYQTPDVVYRTASGGGALIVDKFLRFFTLTQNGVGIAERVAVGVLRQEGQHCRLRPTAHRHVVALDLRVLAVIRDRMEIKVERSAGKQRVRRHRAVPSRDQTGRLGMVETGRILGEITLLRDRVQATEQRQLFIQLGRS